MVVPRGKNQAVNLGLTFVSAICSPINADNLSIDSISTLYIPIKQRWEKSWTRNGKVIFSNFNLFDDKEINGLVSSSCYVTQRARCILISVFIKLKRSTIILFLFDNTIEDRIADAMRGIQSRRRFITCRGFSIVFLSKHGNFIRSNVCFVIEITELQVQLVGSCFFEKKMFRNFVDYRIWWDTWPFSAMK